MTYDWVLFGKPQKPANRELVLIFSKPDVIALRIWDEEKQVFVDSREREDKLDVYSWMPIPPALGWEESK